MVLVGVSAATGVYWPDSVAGVFVVIGFALILAGLALLATAGSVIRAVGGR